MKLTKKSVEAASLGDSQRKLWDSDLKGFGLKVSPGGAKTYFVRYRDGQGRSAKLREFTIARHGELTVEQARSEAAKVLSRARLGQDPQRAREQARAELTLSALCDLYLDRGVATKKTSTLVADRARIRAHIKPLLGAKPLSAIKTGDVSRFMQDVAEGKTAVRQKPTKAAVRADRRNDTATGKPGTRKRTDPAARGGEGTATRTIGLLGAIFSFAIKEGLISQNPVRGVEKFKDRSSQRFLSKQEVGDLTAALTQAELDGVSAQGIAVIRLLILTGARKGEIEGLTWDEVDMGRSCLRLKDSKTGARVLHLGAPALQILSQISREAESRFVFPSPKATGSHYVGTPKVWEKVKLRAGLRGVRLHDLRHTFASFGVANGFSLPFIAALLGHRDVKTTQQYAHLADDPVRAAADRIAIALTSAGINTVYSC